MRLFKITDPWKDFINNKSQYVYHGTRYEKIWILINESY